MTPANHFAENIKAIRKAHGYTQQQVADRIPCKRAAYAAYEEERSEPDLTRLARICEILCVTVDEIFAPRKQAA